MDESNFIPMSDKNYSRPAQIPIRTERFEYLTKIYKPEAEDGRWVMFHHPGHFRIYDRETRYCIFDAAYTILKNPEEGTPGDIVAVVTDIKISTDESRHEIIEEDFRVIDDLIVTEL